VGQALHLVGRFLGSIRPGPPRAEDEAWAIDHLLVGERQLWERMNNPDRRHAVGVAKQVADRWPELGRHGDEASTPPRPVVAAALLHDVGKVDSGLRTPTRVLATLVWAVLDDEVADRWMADRSTGSRSRIARYRRHPEIGADLLRQAGADPLTATWAEQHHWPEERWTLDSGVATVLKECDDD